MGNVNPLIELAVMLAISAGSHHYTISQIKARIAKEEEHALNKFKRDVADRQAKFGTGPELPEPGSTVGNQTKEPDDMPIHMPDPAMLSNLMQNGMPTLTPMDFNDSDDDEPAAPPPPPVALKPPSRGRGRGRGSRGRGNVMHI